MPQEISIDPAVLAKIPSGDREAVHASLKATIERELAHLGSADAASGCEHNKEAGPLHSKDFMKCNPALVEHNLTNKLVAMDDKQYSRFSERLAALKGGGT